MLTLSHQAAEAILALAEEVRVLSLHFSTSTAASSSSRHRVISEKIVEQLRDAEGLGTFSLKWLRCAVFKLSEMPRCIAGLLQ